MNDESEEIKKLKEQRMREAMKQQQQMAASLLTTNGDNYITSFGIERYKKEFELMRDGLRTWNGITHSTIIFNLQTINAMIFMLSSVSVNDMSVSNHVKFQEMYMLCCAIRNQLIRERNETIAKSNPDLSTP